MVFGSLVSGEVELEDGSIALVDGVYTEDNVQDEDQNEDKKD